MDDDKLAKAKSEIGENLNDWTDILQRAANSLLVAHGGALLACLSQLKDYGTNPQLKHIGFLIASFAAGFMIATLAYIDIAMGRIRLKLALFRGDAAGFKEMPVQRGVALLYLSVGVLLLAVLAVAWRFFWL